MTHPNKNNYDKDGYILAMERYVEWLEGKQGAGVWIYDKEPAEERYYHTKGATMSRYWHNDRKQWDQPAVKVIAWLNESASPKQISDEDKWISVEDELPIAYTPVLLCFEKESEGLRAIMRTGFSCGNDFIIDGNKPILSSNISHWQPLPSPPQKTTTTP